MGESAGAGSVGHHLLGPDEGLFSGAIAQSGGPFASSPFPSDKDIEESYRITLNETGCTNSVDPLDCLRGVPADLI
jgi:carboxylesterase type B